MYLPFTFHYKDPLKENIENDFHIHERNQDA